MKTWFFRCFFAPFLLLSVCVSAGFSQKAPRIVSLAPSITSTLNQLNADQYIVGRTSYCPAASENRPNVVVGNVMEVNLEKIISLKPDIVFCMAFTKPDIIEKLTGMGIQVRDFKTPESFDEICEQTMEIGRLAGIGEQARSMVEAEKRRVEEISRDFLQRFPFEKTPGVFFQIGTNPVFPVSEGTFMNQYLSFLGLENIVTDYKGGGISREYVLGKNPDIMIISRMSGMGEDVADEWKRLKNIKAVKNSRILLIDDTTACCPTPVFFRQTLQFLAEHLRKM